MQALIALEKTGSPITRDRFILVAGSPGPDPKLTLFDRQETDDERLTALRGLARFPIRKWPAFSSRSWKTKEHRAQGSCQAVPHRDHRQGSPPRPRRLACLSAEPSPNAGGERSQPGNEDLPPTGQLIARSAILVPTLRVGTQGRDALRHVSSQRRTETCRRASRLAFPRRAWERGFPEGFIAIRGRFAQTPRSSPPACPDRRRD